MPDPAPDAPDPLDALRAQLDATLAATQAIAAEVAAARAEHERTEIPPMGWATPEDRTARSDELRSLVELVESLRALVPPELEQSVRDLLRQLLLLVRAVVDWWVGKLDAALADPGLAGTARPESSGPTDIPIT